MSKTIHTATSPSGKEYRVKKCGPLKGEYYYAVTSGTGRWYHVHGHFATAETAVECAERHARGCGE